MTACSQGPHCPATGCGTAATPRPEPVRARLLAALPAGAADRGVYVLDPRVARSYPGSRFDQLLPTDEGALLVEADAGPVALLSGLPASAAVGPAQTVEAGPAGRTAVLAEDPTVVTRLASGGLDPRLDALAATTAPFAWAGPVGDGVRALVTFDGSRVTATLAGARAADVRSALAGSLPGSPGKPWSDVVHDVHVSGSDPVVVTATAADLPPQLLRELLDQASGATP